MTIPTMIQQRPGSVGQPVKRREDARLLTGHGRFVDDIHLPGTLSLVFVRSSQAHARVRKIDTRACAALPGVVLVLTADQVKGQVKPIAVHWRHPENRNVENACLAEGKVRYVGEPLALVVAADRATAEDAAALVEVAYEPLAPVVDAEEAARPEAPLLYEGWGTNHPCPVLPIGNGDIEAAFRRADRVIRVPRLISSRSTGVPMETRGCLAAYDPTDDVLLVYSSTQVPNQVRTALAQSLSLGESQVRVVAHDVGGGFGVKVQAYPEEVLVGYAARLLRRPVKWIEDRREHFVATTHARQQVHRDIELAVTDDGQLLGIRDHIIIDVGAHFTSRGPLAGVITASMLPGPYRIGAAAIEVEAVCTNKTPEGPCRGYGMPEAVYVMERVLDIAAAALGMDPAELRRRNLLRPEEIQGYQTATGVYYDNGDYPWAFERALQLLDYEGVRAHQREQRRLSSAAERPLVGLGLSFVVEFTGLGPSWYLPLIGFPVPANEAAPVEIDLSGKVTLRTGITPVGQGTETALAQIAAAELGVPLEDVRVLWGDTDVCPYSGMSTAASRGIVVGGSALALSCRVLREKVGRIAAHLLEAAEGDIELREGCVYVAGEAEPRLTLREVALVAYLGAGLPPGMTPGLAAREVFDPPAIPFSYAAHAALVEVDPATGQVEVCRYAVAHDCGTVVNPALVEGQIHGGVAQGIGAALQEELCYDEFGQPLTTTLQDYHPPRAAQVPPIVVAHLETPSPTNPLGAKGMGEGGTIGATAAVVNAVADALAPLGVTITRAPLTPERVWHLIHESTEGSVGGGSRTPAALRKEDTHEGIL